VPTACLWKVTARWHQKSGKMAIKMAMTHCLDTDVKMPDDKGYEIIGRQYSNQ
jgi:hypothetical protein